MTVVRPLRDTWVLPDLDKGQHLGHLGGCLGDVRLQHGSNQAQAPCDCRVLGFICWWLSFNVLAVYILCRGRPSVVHVQSDQDVIGLLVLAAGPVR